MSMLGCSCGETIYDRTDNLPYKGYAIADTQWFELFDRISAEVAAYIRARVAGTGHQWLSEYFRRDTTREEQEIAICFKNFPAGEALFRFLSVNTVAYDPAAEPELLPSMADIILK